MRTRFVEINSFSIDEYLINEIVEILIRGGIIGYPTETVYGLGGDAFNENSVERIYQLKGRNTKNPLLVLVSQERDVFPLVQDVSTTARILMKHFWPGSLTLVFNASSVLPRKLLGKGNRVGIRVSPDYFCAALMNKFRKPLISTSANPTGMRPAQSASDVFNYFNGKIDLILDGGERKSLNPSTVLDVTVDPPQLIRKGNIKIKDIKRVIGGMSATKDF